MDQHGMTVVNSLSSDRVNWWTKGTNHAIGWDEVRWLRDGPRNSRWTRWSLEIVLKDGRVVCAKGAGRTRYAAPETLLAVRRAATAHGVPAVLTGRPVERFAYGDRVSAPGLYLDPGGEPGLRDWDGRDWSPVLHTDPATPVPDGTDTLATTWSPLSRETQQRHREGTDWTVHNQRLNVGGLMVLTLIVAAGLLAGVGVALHWVAWSSAGVSGRGQAALWAANVFLALSTAGLLLGIRRARRNVRRNQRIADVARETVSLASAHDVASSPATTWIVSRKKGRELRLDAHEIIVSTRRQTSWIAWDDVRWFRDGKHFHLSPRLRNDGWALAIVLKDGSTVTPEATKKTRRASQETIRAVRHAAKYHEIPAVLTGRRVSDKPHPADKPGLYPDPGGEPALREWTGTEWLPSLLVDAAFSGEPGEQGQATIWSPLSRDEQQRQWHAAIASVPRWYIVVKDVLGVVVRVAFAVYPAGIVVQQVVKHGWWLATNPVAAVAVYAGTFLWTCAWGAHSLVPVRDYRAIKKVARAARAASARAAAEAEAATA